MVVELRFPIAKIWKQPKYSPTNGQIEKRRVYPYNGNLFSLKKERTLPFATRI